MLTRQIHLLVLSQNVSLLSEVKTILAATYTRVLVELSPRLEVDSSSLPTVILLDWRDGGCRCEAFVRHLRRHPQTAYLPVIFLAENVTDALIAALRYEATDMISQWDLRDGLGARVMIALRHRDAYRRLDQHNRALKQLAAFDDLTGLYNRRYILDALASEMLAAEGGRGIGVFLIDLDNFKKVNDTCGHMAGDEVLKAFAQLLKDCLRAVDLVGRYGGDEFCLIKSGATYEDCVAVATRLLDCVSRESLSEHTGCGFHVTPSIGVAYAEVGCRWTVQELLGAADTALYKAKQNGRNSFEINTLDGALVQ